MDSAITSRSFTVDIQLDKEGMLKRIKNVLPNMCPGASMEDKLAVLNLLQADGKLDMRSLVNGVRIKQSGSPRWERLIQQYAN